MRAGVKSFIKDLGKWLHKPWVILSAICGGALFGILWPSVALHIGHVGELYLLLLQMCVLPLMITAIISRSGKLFLKRGAGEILKRVAKIFGLGLVAAMGLAIVISLLFRPGHSLGEHAHQVIGRLIAEEEVGSSDPNHARMMAPSFMDFAHMIIPTNPFAAVAEGKNLAILFFSFLVGAALGLVRTKGAVHCLANLQAVFEALLKVITWVMYGMPIGFFCLFASQIARVGFEILPALLGLIVTMYCAVAVLFIVHLYLISSSTGKSMKEVLRHLRKPLFVALGTSSSSATVPVAMITLQEEMKMNKDAVDLIMPVGVSFNPQGTIIFFTTVVYFMAQLYNLPIDLNMILITALCTLATSVVVTGVPSVVAHSMIAIILQPLALPIEVAHILLLAIDPILDPVVTATNVLSNCSATAVFLKKNGKS